MNEQLIEHLKTLVARAIDLGCAITSQDNVIYVQAPVGWHFNGDPTSTMMPLDTFTMETTVTPSIAAEILEGRF